MSRIHKVSVALVFTAFAVPAFASDSASIGRTRDEVKAELIAAIKDGTMAKMRHNRSYLPAYEMPSRTAMSQPDNLKEQLAKGEGPLIFPAPAAGARTRAEVLLELQRAREDGSLRRMNSNRGY